MTYDEFLAQKKRVHKPSGFEIHESDLNPHLFDFQRFCVSRALKAGKYALFEDCGLGKTLQQLEWAYQVVRHTGGGVLVVAPLAVVAQTIREGEKFGIWVRDYDDYPLSDTGTGIFVTNYENLNNVCASDFMGVVLDESSILKNFDGKTKQQIIEMFADTPYKLSCTATPSPNDIMELGNQAEFLDVMSRAEMLAMYFVHDGGNTTSWRLKGHCRELFWDFVSTWAVMLCKPSDIGFSDDGYNLPPLDIEDVMLETELRDSGLLFNDISVNATNYNQELRLTMDARMAKAAEIVNDSAEQWIVWIKQDAEGDMLQHLIPDAVEVRGSDKNETKRERLLGFAEGKFRVLITKLKIAQFGLNFQNCHNQIFASLDFSFESTYQGIRRSWRFGQDKQVNIKLICTETMQNVKATIDEKQKQFADMQLAMVAATSKNVQTIAKKKVARQYTQVQLPAFLRNGSN